MTRQISLPELLDRVAGKYDHQELGYSPHHNDDPNDPDDLLHLVHSQYTIVLEKERELEEGQCQVVENN